PSRTQSIAIIVDDPDAPKKTFTHWIVYDLPSTMRGLPEGTSATPNGARAGENDFGTTGYRGPCPPSGRHRYVVKVFALDVMLPDLKNPRADALEGALTGHVLSRGQLMGTYAKNRT